MRVEALRIADLGDEGAKKCMMAGLSDIESNWEQCVQYNISGPFVHCMYI